MTRRILRGPDPSRLIIHTKAVHDDGACLTGCPWCIPTPESDRLPIVIIDDTKPQRNQTHASE